MAIQFGEEFSWYSFIAIISVQTAKTGWETQHADYTSSLNFVGDISILFADKWENSSWMVDPVLNGLWRQEIIACLTINHEVAGSIPGTSTILNVD